MYECFHCGHRTVGWCNDFSFEDYGYEGEGIVHVLHCSNCGAEIEYYISFDDEDDHDNAEIESEESGGYMDNKELENEVMEFNEDDMFVLTEWGCLLCVLNDYGIDVTHIPGRVGNHIVEDFMDMMVKCGYIGKKEDAE